MVDEDEGDAGGRSAAHLRRIPALDGLRGVAVAAVLAFHDGHLTGGFLGVDLFFVLSGYLITSLLVVEWLDRGTIRLRNFWVRRARRLLPALLCLLVLVGLAAKWEVRPISRGPLREAGLATLAQVANWQAIWSGNGYWDQTLLPSWLEHTWSLAIEEQVYLAWPLVVFVLLGGVRLSRSRPADERPRSRQRTVRRLGTAALVGAALSGGSMIVRSFAGTPVERLYLGTDTRVAAVLLGAWVVCLQRSGEMGGDLLPRRRQLLSDAAHAAAGFLVVAWIAFDGTDDSLYRGGLFACGVAAAAIIADLATPGPTTFLGRVLAWRPLVWLGTISYGLYLYHWPIYQYLYPGRFGLDGWANTVARLAASVGAAVASYVLLERPIRERRWRIDLRFVVPAGVAVTVLALVLGTAGGIDPSPPTVPVAVATTAPDPDRPPRTDGVDLLVVGDSVALSLVEGWAPDPVSPRLTVINDGAFGCALMDPAEVVAELPVHDCTPDWPAMVAGSDPDVALLLFGAWTGVRAADVDGDAAFPCTRRFDTRYRERFEESIDVLTAGGAQVLLATAPGAPPAYDRTHPEEAEERQECSNAILHDIARERDDTDLVDLAEWVCPPSEDCREEADGATLRPDGLHFRGDGARAVARWLTPRILEVADREADAAAPASTTTGSAPPVPPGSVPATGPVPGSASPAGP